MSSHSRTTIRRISNYPNKKQLRNVLTDLTRVASVTLPPPIASGLSTFRMNVCNVLRRDIVSAEGEREFVGGFFRGGTRVRFVLEIDWAKRAG